MRFIETPIHGAWVIEPEPQHDQRGLFARTWCQQEMAAHGLATHVAQCAVSFSPCRGTLRGLHYQVAPHAEQKLVRVTQGAAFDVIVDLRPDSPTLHGWHAVELSAANRRMVLAPPGCAHGLLTLDDNTEVSYQFSQPFFEPASRGVRYDDPALQISWPRPVLVISDRDRKWPLLASVDTHAHASAAQEVLA